MNSHSILGLHDNQPLTSRHFNAINHHFNVAVTLGPEMLLTIV